MSLARLLRSATSGALLVNAVPHGVSALQGRPFPSPFSSPPGVGDSAPAVNVAWSATNVLAGTALRIERPTRAERVATVVGGVAAALVIAGWFGGGADRRS